MENKLLKRGIAVPDDETIWLKPGMLVYCKNNDAVFLVLKVDYLMGGYTNVSFIWSGGKKIWTDRFLGRASLGAKYYKVINNDR